MKREEVEFFLFLIFLLLLASRALKQQQQRNACIFPRLVFFLFFSPQPQTLPTSEYVHSVCFLVASPFKTESHGRQQTTTAKKKHRSLSRSFVLLDSSATKSNPTMKSRYVILISGLSKYTRSRDIREECERFGTVMEVERDIKEREALVEFKQ